MATKFLEPGGDSDFGTGLWSAVYAGAPQIVTDFVHGSHKKSIQYRANNEDVLSKLAVLADAGGRVSFWVYFTAFPTAGEVQNRIISLKQTADALNIYRVIITNAGVIQIWNNTGQIGSNGTTLSTGTWYRMSFAWTVTSTTVNQFNLWINGVSSNSVTNATLGGTGLADFYLGNRDTDTQMDFRSSDHYIDNSNALTDPGNIWVTAKRPNANGTTNGFTTQIGAGGSGYGTGHSPQVNERPQSDTNGWSMIGAGSAITEEYNIENAATGDISLIGATIVDYMGWVRANSLAGETASIIVNNVTSNISLTSTTAYFTNIAGSSTYPAGSGTDIGIITTTDLTTVSLYEAGMIVAYIPASNTSFGSMVASMSFAGNLKTM